MGTSCCVIQSQLADPNRSPTTTPTPEIKPTKPETNNIIAPSPPRSTNSSEASPHGRRRILSLSDKPFLTAHRRSNQSSTGDGGAGFLSVLPPVEIVIAAASTSHRLSIEDLSSSKAQNPTTALRCSIGGLADPQGVTESATPENESSALKAQPTTSSSTNEMVLFDPKIKRNETSLRESQSREGTTISVPPSVASAKTMTPNIKPDADLAFKKQRKKRESMSKRPSLGLQIGKGFANPPTPPPNRRKRIGDSKFKVATAETLEAIVFTDNPSVQEPTTVGPITANVAPTSRGEWFPTLEELQALANQLKSLHGKPADSPIVGAIMKEPTFMKIKQAMLRSEESAQTGNGFHYPVSPRGKGCNSSYKNKRTASDLQSYNVDSTSDIPNQRSFTKKPSTTEGENLSDSDSHTPLYSHDAFSSYNNPTGRKKCHSTVSSDFSVPIVKSSRRNLAVVQLPEIVGDQDSDPSMITDTYKSATQLFQSKSDQILQQSADGDDSKQQEEEEVVFKEATQTMFSDHNNNNIDHGMFDASSYFQSRPTVGVGEDTLQKLQVFEQAKRESDVNGGGNKTIIQFLGQSPPISKGEILVSGSMSPTNLVQIRSEDSGYVKALSGPGTSADTSPIATMLKRQFPKGGRSPLADSGGLVVPGKLATTFSLQSNRVGTLQTGEGLDQGKDPRLASLVLLGVADPRADNTATNKQLNVANSKNNTLYLASPQQPSTVSYGSTIVTIPSLRSGLGVESVWSMVMVEGAAAAAAAIESSDKTSLTTASNSKSKALNVSSSSNTRRGKMFLGEVDIQPPMGSASRPATSNGSQQSLLVRKLSEGKANSYSYETAAENAHCEEQQVPFKQEGIEDDGRRQTLTTLPEPAIIDDDDEYENVFGPVDDQMTSTAAMNTIYPIKDEQAKPPHRELEDEFRIETKQNQISSDSTKMNGLISQSNPDLIGVDGSLSHSPLTKLPGLCDSVLTATASVPHKSLAPMPPSPKNGSSSTPSTNRNPLKTGIPTVKQQFFMNNLGSTSSVMAVSGGAGLPHLTAFNINNSEYPTDLSLYGEVMQSMAISGKHGDDGSDDGTSSSPANSNNNRVPLPKSFNQRAKQQQSPTKTLDHSVFAVPATIHGHQRDINSTEAPTDSSIYGDVMQSMAYSGKVGDDGSEVSSSCVSSIRGNPKASQRSAAHIHRTTDTQKRGPKPFDINNAEGISDYSIYGEVMQSMAVSGRIGDDDAGMSTALVSSIRGDLQGASMQTVSVNLFRNGDLAYNTSAPGFFDNTANPQSSVGKSKLEEIMKEAAESVLRALPPIAPESAFDVIMKMLTTSNKPESITVQLLRNMAQPTTQLPSFPKEAPADRLTNLVLESIPPMRQSVISIGESTSTSPLRSRYVGSAGSPTSYHPALSNALSVNFGAASPIGQNGSSNSKGQQNLKVLDVLGEEKEVFISGSGAFVKGNNNNGSPRSRWATFGDSNGKAKQSILNKRMSVGADSDIQSIILPTNSINNFSSNASVTCLPQAPEGGQSIGKLNRDAVAQARNYLRLLSPKEALTMKL